MVFDRDEVADVLGRITPEDATDLESLHTATAYAMGHIDVVADKALAVATGAHGHHAAEAMQRADGWALFVLRTLVALRNGWLKEHGAYRNG